MPEASKQLRVLAQRIRDNVFHSGSIAEAFELIADAMKPCVDCGEAAKPGPDAPAFDLVQHASQKIDIAAVATEAAAADLVQAPSQKIESL